MMMNKENKNGIKNEIKKENEDYIIGRNSVKQYIESGKNVNKIYIQNNATRAVSSIYKLAKQNKIPIVTKDKSFFKDYPNSQGVLAQISNYEYYDVSDLIKGENPFILILDGIEDVNNLGAIIRTAECANLDGIIIPKRGAAQITPTVSKIAQGALSNIKIAQVSNINDCIIKLKEKGFWIVGSSLDDSQSYKEIDYNMPLALVVGNEAKGISKKTLEKCDFKVKIPMYGMTQSLNVSVATGILVFNALDSRAKK